MSRAAVAMAIIALVVLPSTSTGRSDVPRVSTPSLAPLAYRSEPPVDRPDRSRERVPASPVSAPARPLTGVASWFRAADGTAAAGPELRAFLGPEWRGSSVRVCLEGQHCRIVVLDDWCFCYRNEPRERIIDLSHHVFADLAPLSRGLIIVTIYPES